MNRIPVSVLLALLMMLPVMAGAQSAGDSVIVVPADTLRSESELRAASTRYAAAVRVCYEREGLKEDPSLSATVDIGMTVQPDGSVKEITIDTLSVTGIGISRVAECVAKAAIAWRFTAGAYGIERTILSFKLVPPRSD
jgi:hypothetical protein